MARARNASASGNESNTTQGETKMADTTKGSLTSLKLVPVDDDVLDAARGGRGHGEYDNFLPLFIEAGIRGTEVGFDGVKSNSIKTGLKSAIDRAVKAGTVAEGDLQVMGKDDHVYIKWSPDAWAARQA